MGESKSVKLLDFTQRRRDVENPQQFSWRLKTLLRNLHLHGVQYMNILFYNTTLDTLSLAK